MLTIRLETPADEREVEELTRAAFWNQYVPGCDEHYLVHIMREKPEFLPELALVAELDGQLVGDIMYTTAWVADDAGRRQEVLTFGPVSVAPAAQRRGISKALIEESFRRAREMGYSGVVTYGDPRNYVNRGFRNGKCFGIHSGDGKFPAALLACELRPDGLAGISGGFQVADFFNLDPNKAAVFDREFPPMEKLENTPAQRRFQEISSQFED